MSVLTCAICWRYLDTHKGGVECEWRIPKEVDALRVYGFSEEVIASALRDAAQDAAKEGIPAIPRPSPPSSIETYGGDAVPLWMYFALLLWMGVLIWALR